MMNRRRRIARLASAISLTSTAVALISQSVVAEASWAPSDHYRFLFCSEGKVLLELSRDYLEKTAHTDSLEQDIPWSWVAEREGEKYTAYFLESKGFETITLMGLARYPSGDGGIGGIAGVVETSAASAKACYNYATIGVAYTLPLSQMNQRLPQDVKLPKALRKALRGMGGKYRGRTYPNVEARTVITIVKQRISEGREVVRVFHVDGTNITELAFPENVFREGKSLLVHDPNGETDVTPIDGEFIILPDFDGNGYPEFIVDDTGTSLYSIERSGSELPTIVLKRSLYFGP